MKKKEGFQVILFDAGHTLLRPKNKVGYTYAELARTRGWDLDPQQVEINFRKAFKALSVKPLDSEANQTRWWREVVTNAVGSPPAGFDFEGYFADLWNFYANADAWDKVEGCDESLHQLKKQGYRLGVVSNWDSRLLTLLNQTGLHQYFEKVYISALVGWAKPDPRIFIKAIGEFSVLPGKVIHIGDDLINDWQGASNAGIKALILDPGNKFEIPERHKLSKLMEIPKKIKNLENNDLKIRNGFN